MLNWLKELQGIIVFFFVVMVTTVKGSIFLLVSYFYETF